jgi:hypothetical protein
MAKHWYVDTNASQDEIVNAFREVFFSRPTMGTRLKVWSKAAQMQSNLKWEPTGAENALVAAVMVSGGIREAVADSKRGPGSGIGTTVALAVDGDTDVRQAQLWLGDYNTFVGFNQQGDVLKSYTKQVASQLVAAGHTANAHK